MMSDLKMPEMNITMISGRLTRDPELRYLPSGTAVCNFGIASERRYKTKEGQQEKDVYYGDCKVFGAIAEWVNQNLTKGRPVMVEGRLTTEEWEVKDGSRRSATRILCNRVQSLDWAEKSDTGRPTYKPEQKPRDYGQYEIPPDPDDDIPF